jgi:hypothetical protein
MNDDTLFFTILVATFAIALGLEWRYHLKILQLGASVLALALLLFFQPPYHAAWRRAISAPPSERITHWPTTSPDSVGTPLTEYQSGVFTMHRAVIDVHSGYSRERWLMVGVLTWFACSPAFRQTRGAAAERTGLAASADGSPEA